MTLGQRILLCCSTHGCRRCTGPFDCHWQEGEWAKKKGGGERKEGTALESRDGRSEQHVAGRPQNFTLLSVVVLRFFRVPRQALMLHLQMGHDAAGLEANQRSMQDA
jgi:hypothetical protein